MRSLEWYNRSLIQGVEIFQGHSTNIHSNEGVMSIRSIKSGEIDTFEIGHFYGWGYPWTRTFRQG